MFRSLTEWSWNDKHSSDEGFPEKNKQTLSAINDFSKAYFKIKTSLQENQRYTQQSDYRQSKILQDDTYVTPNKGNETPTITEEQDK